MNVLEKLNDLAETEYKRFNKKIIPTQQKILGVRTPALRKIAKEIVKNDPHQFIQQDKQDVYELVMLEGMTLSYLDKSFSELLPLTEQFLGKVDNWAQIDSTVSEFRNIKKEPDEVLAIVKNWLQSDKEFIVRAGLVILLAHYVEKEYLDTVFNLSQKVTHKGYYVHMGNAWLISVCMAKFPDETILFFENNNLDKKTHNKAIQKSRESYRVSKENKDLLVTLKKK